MHHSELTQLALNLDAIAKQYVHETSRNLFNVSHWDADETYHHIIAKSLRLPAEVGSRFDYEFSQTLPRALLQSTARQLGVTDSQAIQITPSGTSANLLALALLKHFGKSRLIIAGPCYFQVPLLAQSLGIDVVHADAWLPTVGYDVSAMPLHNIRNDAVWITNPAYCFGAYCFGSDCEMLVDILKAGFTIVADECNSLNGRELGRTLSKFENFIGTYAPHKSACVNGLKFGAMTTGMLDPLALNHLGDAWVGPLPRSIRTDMKHFASKNFFDIQEIYLNLVEKFSRLMQSRITEMPLLLHEGIGHFRVLSFGDIPNSLELSSHYLKEVFYHAQASFFPMVLNYGPQGLGLSFRINLLRNFSQLLDTIPKLVEVISSNTFSLR